MQFYSQTKPNVCYKAGIPLLVGPTLCDFAARKYWYIFAVGSKHFVLSILYVSFDPLWPYMRKNQYFFTLVIYNSSHHSHFTIYLIITAEVCLYHATKYLERLSYKWNTISTIKTTKNTWCMLPTLL